MSTFWRLLEKSTIVSGVLATLMTGAVCYCAINEIALPDYLVATFSVVITFFFTSKMKDEGVTQYHS